MDAVSLAVPTVDHARIGLDLLEHGIDVLVEKPISATIDEARTEIEGLLEDSPSLRREADSLIKKQIGAAAKLAADDLRQHGEPEGAIGARLAAGGFTAEQVLGDWFPERDG